MGKDAPLVLVTGGAGFIGSHTVDRLIAQRCRVLVVDDLSTGSIENLRQWQDDDRVTFVEADITDDFSARLEQVASSLGRIDRIIHFAAQTAVPLSVEDPVADMHVNLLGSAKVLEHARRAGVPKVVFASSSAVYDDDAPVPVSESSATRPSSPYGVNKLAVEFYLGYYARMFGLKYTALRFMNVYGPRQDPNCHYSGVISIFLERAVSGKPITIFDDGEQTRDFVYVTDVAAVTCKATLSSAGDNAIINIGNGVEVSINNLVRMALDLAESSSPIYYAPPRPGDIRRSVTSIGRASALLEFAPTMRLQEGLAETLAWVRSQRGMPVSGA